MTLKKAHQNLKARKPFDRFMCVLSLVIWPMALPLAYDFYQQGKLLVCTWMLFLALFIPGSTIYSLTRPSKNNDHQ